MKDERQAVLAFCLFKYFPFGGLQRDFLAIAQACLARGFKIRVYVLSWQGEIPDTFEVIPGTFEVIPGTFEVIPGTFEVIPGTFEVIIVPTCATTNHRKHVHYHTWVQNHLASHPVQGVIGFNKMPGLDIYYAADSCYEEKARTQRSWLYRLLPRYKHFAQYESAVFGKDSKTEILMISHTQKLFFERHYQTRGSRMHFLPPGIGRDRIAPENAASIRLRKRAELGIKPDEHLLLMVGSGFIKKGLGRALYAIRSLPVDIRQTTRFLIVGEDWEAPFRLLTWFLGIKDRVEFLAGRDDVAEILLASDLMLHPAKDENAGIVLLEAIVAGLPLLATANCGYAHYIVEADMGVLVSNPFRQGELNAQLLTMISANRRAEWQERGKRFAHSANIYSLHQDAASIIERLTPPPPPTA